MIRNRDSINTKHLETLYDPDTKNPIKIFNQKQFNDGQQRNLAKFIDYRIENQMNLQMADFKDSLRREIDQHRQDSYFQIEHYYRNVAVQKRYIEDEDDQLAQTDMEYQGDIQGHYQGEFN